MRPSMPYIPPNIYLLADNLDAALAAGEDIMKADLVWAAGSGREGADIADARATQRAMLRNVQTLEQVLVARILKSRERSEEIGKRDPRFATVARLYNAGTAILIEAVTDFGDPASLDFESGGDAVAFLRTHGLLPEDAAGPADGAVIKFSDDFLVAGRVRLGTLLDLVAMYLDTLETYYDLFSDVIVEPDLLPYESDAGDADAEAAPPAHTDALAASDEEPDSEDVEALRRALAEVRGIVALDQR